MKTRFSWLIALASVTGCLGNLGANPAADFLAAQGGVDDLRVARQGWLHTFVPDPTRLSQQPRPGLYNADGTPWMGRGAVLMDPRSCNSCTYSSTLALDAEKVRADILVNQYHANFIRIVMESYDSPTQFDSKTPRISWQSALHDQAYLDALTNLVNYVTAKPGVYVELSVLRDGTLDSLLWPTVDDMDRPGTRCDDAKLGDTTTCLWKKLAGVFANNAQVIYGVDGEPAQNGDGALDAVVWQRLNACAQVIRDVEQSLGTPQHIIAVPGTRQFARGLQYFASTAPDGTPSLHPIAAGGGKNVVYETHPYVAAAGFAENFLDTAKYLPVIIGEFGPFAMSYDDCQVLIARAEAAQLPYVAWAFHPKCGDLSLTSETANVCSADSASKMQLSPWGAWYLNQLKAAQLSDGVNVAQGKPTVQSSTYGNAISNLAVDGNLDGIFDHGSVTHTQDSGSTDPYWQVDLGASFNVTGINLWNRVDDCCAFRLLGARIYISEQSMQGMSAAQVEATNNVYVVDAPVSAATPPTYVRTKARGRFVRVQLLGPNRILSLAEVQVFAASDTVTASGTNVPVNVALFKNTRQSTTSWNAPGSRAVDGRIDANFFAGSMTHTADLPGSTDPFWEVDLGASFNLTAVALYGRSDCCTSRLSQPTVFVSDTPFKGSDFGSTSAQENVRVFNIENRSQQLAAVVATPVTGRYVRVMLRGRNRILSLAEVEVYATGVPVGAQAELARGRNAMQSSQAYGGAAQRGVDGNESGDWMAGSVTHTDLQSAPFWQVDLGSAKRISLVALFNRTDCCTDRLLGAQVLISTTDFGSATAVSTRVAPNQYGYSIAVRTGTPLLLMPMDVTGRYVRVELLGDARYLSLGEIEVFGSP